MAEGGFVGLTGPFSGVVEMEKFLKAFNNLSQMDRRVVMELVFRFSDLVDSRRKFQDESMDYEDQLLKESGEMGPS